MMAREPPYLPPKVMKGGQGDSSKRKQLSHECWSRWGEGTEGNLRGEDESFPPINIIPDVSQVGLGFGAVPPNPLLVERVVADSWGERQGHSGASNQLQRGGFFSSLDGMPIDFFTLAVGTPRKSELLEVPREQTVHNLGLTEAPARTALDECWGTQVVATTSFTSCPFPDVFLAEFALAWQDSRAESRSWLSMASWSR